ncbi:MAG: glycosyltransferase family 4 protein [Candidatus Sumerlaeia bacterium]|nr:glycosyltransferase family 4 protein [Candidatus Sumerlaeia bacterium]
MTRRALFCFHDNEPTGASLWLYNLLRGDGDPRWTPHAVFPGASPMADELQARGVECHQVALEAGDLVGGGSPISRLGNRVRSLGAYRRLFREVKADLVYTNTSVQVASMLAARLESCPLLIHVHEGYGHFHAGGKRSATFPLKKWAVRRLAQGCLFAATEGMRLFGDEPKGRKWRFSPNGVDPSLATPRADKNTLRGVIGLPVGKMIVLFLGSLCRRKGTHDLLECWPRILADFPDAHLVLAGKVPQGEDHPALLSLEKSPPPGVQFLGFRRDAADLLHASDFMALPSYGEAMPLSISEAMMAGIPVVARDVGDIVYQIGDGRGYLFEGDGTAPLEAALRAAMSNPGEAGIRGNAAARFAREKLLLATQHRQVWDFCTEISGA